VSISFATLSTTAEQDGQVYWCRDCSQAPVCTGNGTGAVAVGAASQWTCVLGPIPVSGAPSGGAGGDLIGSYPNPTVAHVSGGKVPVTTANGVNVLSPATGNYSMGNNRVMSLGSDLVSGDALSRGQSTLNSLAPPIAAVNMNNQTLQSMPGASAGGQPVVAGVTNTAIGTFLQVNNRINPIAANNARADAIACTNGGSISGVTLTVSGCSGFPGFSAADSGKYITVSGAGPGGAAYQGTLTFVSSGSATLSPASTANVSNKPFTYGTDNTTPFQNAEAQCERTGNLVDIPPGTYISGTVQLGQLSTQATPSQTNQAPSCYATIGGGRFTTRILVKPGMIGFERHNTSGTSVVGIDFDGALQDGLVGDNMLGGLDMSWLGGAPSTGNNVRDIEARWFDGTGINLYLNNDANLGEFWSVPGWANGQTVTATITSCSTAADNVCNSGYHATCTVSANPFTTGQWITLAGNASSGFNMAAETQLIGTTGSSFTYCPNAGPLTAGSGGTASLVPVSIDARGPGGHMEVHNFISSAGVMVMQSQNWRLSDFGIYGGLLILPNDYNEGELDSGQILGGDPYNSDIMIEAAPGPLNNLSVHSLNVNNIFVAGPPVGTAYVFDGHYWNGLTWKGGEILGEGGALSVFDTISPGQSGNSWWPRFDFQGIALDNAIFNPPNDIVWSLKASCEGSASLTGGSILGSPVTCPVGVGQINMQSVFSAGGTPVPGPGSNACSPIHVSAPPICIADTSTANCPIGTSYVSGGSYACRASCSGSVWKDVGAGC
jgi:hypothetical protein